MALEVITPPTRESIIVPYDKMASGYDESLRFDVLNACGADAKAADATPLQENCRAKIIQSVGLDRLGRANELPIPQTMVNCLMEQLTIDDFFVHRGQVSAAHVSTCVFPAKCTLDSSDVVLKCFPPCLESEEQAGLVEKWTGLTHPNLMQYFAQFRQAGTHVVVFARHPHPMVDVLSARQEAQNALIPKRLVWKAFVEVCRVLKYLAANHVFYDNLNPEKVTFAKDGTVKLDNGLLYCSADPSGMQMAMESPEAVYSSPEVLEGQEQTEKSYVWFLGCLLAEMSSLKPAFPVPDGNMFGAMSDVMEGNPSGLDALSENEKTIVMKCFASEPDARPGIGELLEEANKQLAKTDAAGETMWRF